MTIHKIPPHDAMAEKAVLGGILIDNSSITDVAELLQPKHFYFEEHRVIFEAVLGLFEKNQPIDIVTVGSQLKADGNISKLTDQKYLTELIDSVPTSAYVKHYAEIVKNTYIKRTLITMGGHLVEKSFDDQATVQELLDGAESEIFSLSQAFLHRDFVALRDILATSFDRLERLIKSGGEVRGVPTGFASLDRKLAGFQDSNLIILAARPGVGKTTFALNIAMHVALKEKMAVGFFSLEMSKEELVDRLLVGQADIDAWSLKTGRLTDNDYSRLTEAMGELAEAPIYIDDTPGASILEMRTKARKMKIEKDLRLIVVDYLQLAVPGKRFESRVQEVGYISQNLKNLARELQIPVIALSQLNRSIEHRAGASKKPVLADLRESGCLAGSTRITLADTGETVSLVDLVGKNNFNVWSMTPDMKIEKRLVSKVFLSGTKQLFTLHLRSGRTIQATANHKFRMQTEWKRLDGLQVGDRLAMPRKIQQQLEDSSTFTDEQLTLLAHMIGDGCYVSRQPIHYTSNTPEHIQAVVQSAQSAFQIQGRIVQQNTWFHAYLPSPYPLTHNVRHPMMQWFADLGLSFAHSYEKKLPEALYACSERQIGHFLKHLWATDGCIFTSKKSVKIYYATSSKNLADGVQDLLIRLGIQSQIRTVPQIKKGKAYRSNYHVSVQGMPNQMRFLKYVGAFGSKVTQSQLALKILSVTESNPNIDILDSTIWTLINEERVRNGVSWRQLSQRIGMSYCGSALLKSGVGRDRMLKIAQALDSNTLRLYATSDIYWDPIVQITAGEVEDVFDMTVPGTHNFVAQDIVVHNSIEQDADVVMFLYSEDDGSDELMDSTKRMIKLSIAKHRNGATGDIDLMFRGDRVRFYDVNKGEEL